MISHCGVDSVPADIIAFLIASHIRKTLSTGTRSVINSLHAIKAKASGGTLSTALTIYDTYSATQLASATKPFALSPVPSPPSPAPLPGNLLSKLLGYVTVPDLGILTDSPQATLDTVIVHRTWGLLDNGAYYGPHFRFSEWMRARNVFTGTLIHFSLMGGMLALFLPPVRWLLQKIATQPGSGPSKEDTKNDFIKYRAVGEADNSERTRVLAKFEYPGGMYYLTGLCLAEAAMVILRGDGQTEAHKRGGGMMTPAMLGEQYVERLRDAGVELDIIQAGSQAVRSRL